MNASFDSQLESRARTNDPTFAQSALEVTEFAPRGGVVNRTHRVVRQRAKVIRDRRDHVRSLMLPLIICSVLLILSAFAVWSGLYQTPATEAVQDVVSSASTDATDQFLVVLMWFVPVSLAVLAAVWLRRAHASAGHGTVR